MVRSFWTIFHGRPPWTPGLLWIPDLGLGPALPMLPEVVELQGRDQRTEATCGSIPWKFPVMGPRNHEESWWLMGIIFGKNDDHPVWVSPPKLFSVYGNHFRKLAMICFHHVDHRKSPSVSSPPAASCSARSASGLSGAPGSLQGCAQMFVGL